VSVLATVLGAARRRRALVLLAAAAFTAISAVLATRIRFGTNVLGLLPADSPTLRVFADYLARFGTTDALYIVFEAPAGATVEDAAPLIDTYIERLGKLPEIARVDAGAFDPGKDWTYLQDRQFALMGPEAARAALASFEPAGLRTALAASRNLLATSPALGEVVQNDPLGLLSSLRASFGEDPAFSDLDVSRRGYVSADGRSRLVMATPTGPPFDSEFCRRLFVALDGVEADSRRAIPSAEATAGLGIAYAGGHRIALETEGTIRREAVMNGVTSLAGILAFLLIIFRSPWLFLVGAVPMSVATLGSVAVNGLFNRDMSAAATGTSALLFGLGIDGLVLLYSRYLEEMESGLSAEDAIVRLAGPGTSMLLGSSAAAVTFLGLTWIDLPGLQELGRLVGVGMLIGGPLTLVLVAALLPRRLVRPYSLSADWLVAFVRRRPRQILAAAALVTVVLAPLAWRLDVDLRLERLRPDTPAARLERDVMARFGVGRDVALVISEGPDLGRLLELDRQFADALKQDAPHLPARGASRLIPTPADQARTAAVLDDARVRLPAIVRDFRAAAFDAGFRHGAFDGYLERLPRLFDPGQTLTYDGYIGHGLGDLIGHFVRPVAGGFMAVTYVEVPDAADLARVARAAGSVPGMTLTGFPVVNAELTRAFAPQFRLGLTIGVGSVLVLLLLTFRSVRDTGLALLPTVVGLLWSAAILAGLGFALDLFSVFAVLTLVGIGVDYGIHLVHRARAEPGGFDRTLSRIAPANMVAAGIALLGCGSLTLSAYPPLRALGVVTTVSLCTCLATAVLVLPALLVVRAPRGAQDAPEVKV
jgi:predicted RND superfamily exporter protein